MLVQVFRCVDMVGGDMLPRACKSAVYGGYEYHQRQIWCMRRRCGCDITTDETLSGRVRCGQHLSVHWGVCLP